MYSTDNGPHMNSWPDAGMTPFRNEKNSNWEGAYRVPAMVRWPGKIKPGSVSNEIVCAPRLVADLARHGRRARHQGETPEGPQGRRKDLQGPSRRLQPAAVFDGPGRRRARARSSSTSTTTAIWSALRYDNWKIVFMEQRATGTLRIWAEPFVDAARAEDLQPADRSVRAGRYHVEHLLRLAARPRLSAGAGAADRRASFC